MKYNTDKGYFAIIKEFFSRKEKVVSRMRTMIEENPDLFLMVIDPKTGLAITSYKKSYAGGQMDTRTIKQVLKHSQFQKHVFNFLENICLLIGYNPMKVNAKLRDTCDDFYMGIASTVKKMLRVRESVKDMKNKLSNSRSK